MLYTRVYVGAAAMLQRERERERVYIGAYLIGRLIVSRGSVRTRTRVVYASKKRFRVCVYVSTIMFTYLYRCAPEEVYVSIHPHVRARV